MIINWFTKIEFAYPWVLIMLLLPLYLILWYRKNNINSLASLQISKFTKSDNFISLKPLFYHSLFVFRCLVITILILGLARPQEKVTQEYLAGKGIDIMLCHDVSASMEALDFDPNRMEASKRNAIDFVKTRMGDRIGLVIFGAYPLTLCPLTTDTSAIISLLKTIKIGGFDSNNSLISSGLATCINKLKGSKSKSKIIVLLSDGVLEGDTFPIDKGIELAKKYRIRIYTIGIGTKGNVPVLVKITSSGTVISESTVQRNFGFNDTFLKDVASKTGGKYFYSMDEEGLALTYKNISELEKSDIKIKQYSTTSEKLLLFIYAGFIILFIEMCLRYSILKKFP